MKKKLAILFASLSLCACGFIACESNEEDNDSNEKLAIGAECVKNDACESGFCQMDGDKGACAAKIANGDECKNANDLCAGAGYECKAGEGEDSALKCRNDQQEGPEKAQMGDACGDMENGNVECDEDLDLECEARGGEGEDAAQLICKIKADKACAANDICIDGYECKAGDGEDSALKCREVSGDVTPVAKGVHCGTAGTADPDSACAEGLACEVVENVPGSDKICKIIEGGACNEAADADLCGNGLICDGETDAKTCQKPAELNAECLVDVGCGDGFDCVASSSGAVDGVCKIANDNACEASANDSCASGHCKATLVGEGESAAYEWKCADKVAADADCVRLLSLDGNEDLVYTPVCVEGKVCRPDSNDGTSYGGWLSGKCLDALLGLNATCTEAHTDIADENACDYTMGLICHSDGEEPPTLACKGQVNMSNCTQNSDCVSNVCVINSGESIGICGAPDVGGE